MNSPKRLALYLRLSKEDIEKNTRESISESIKNQELMLREEVSKHSNWVISNIYCDEDFSGAGTYRPDFEKMIQSCERGEIDIVLCKSQSRFSRDMEVIEKYLHNKFQEWNVRFISLIDHADSTNEGNKKTRQINALVNEWFLEDLSSNIKSTLRTKWKSGECTSSFAKYGLMKDPKNKNRLLIDPIASEVLKQIATMFLSGYGQDKIARILEEQNIPSPYEYKIMNGCKLKLPFTENTNCSLFSKTGKYILKCSLFNNYKVLLKDIVSFFAIGSEQTSAAHSNFQIKIRSISDNLKLYYTTQQICTTMDNVRLDTLSFPNDWTSVYVDDELPSKVTYIASECETLQQLAETNFELEIILKENHLHIPYKIVTKTFIPNITYDINFSCTIRKKYAWNGRVIYRMLRDEIYHGTLTQGKTKRISYKNHKCIPTPKALQISTENALDKIFGDDVWNAIQKKLNSFSKACANGNRYLFSGKVYCDICGNVMHKNSILVKSSKEKIEYLSCSGKKKCWCGCSNKKSIRLDVLHSYIYQELHQLLFKYYDKPLVNELIKKSINAEFFKDELESLQREKEKIDLFLKKQSEIFLRIYEDHITGMLDNEEFLFLRSKYQEDINKFKKRILHIEKELSILHTKKERAQKRDYLFFDECFTSKMSHEIIDEFIQCIRIGKSNELTKNREIKIIWNI